MGLDMVDEGWWKRILGGRNGISQGYTGKSLSVISERKHFVDFAVPEGCFWGFEEGRRSSWRIPRSGVGEETLRNSRTCRNS